MQVLILLSGAILLNLLGCQNPSNGPGSNNQPHPNKEKIGHIDEAYWTITSKLCNATPLTLLGTERMKFGSGVFAYINQSSSDDISFCYQAQVYNRVILSFSTTPSKYMETSIIMPQLLRKVCRKKNNNEVISDETTEVSGDNENIQIMYDNQKTEVTISGNQQCPDGNLVFQLTK